MMKFLGHKIVQVHSLIIYLLTLQKSRASHTKFNSQKGMLYTILSRSQKTVG